MKKSIWIFLLAVLLPGVVLGWMALRSAEEQQIVFERRTAELYQKETDSLAVTVRDTVDAERRVFGETVRRLLAKGDADALARDFTSTLAAAWPVKAVGFAINRDGKLVSPSVAMCSTRPELRQFLVGNSSFLTSTEPALVYNWAGDNQARSKVGSGQFKLAANPPAGGGAVSNTGSLTPNVAGVSKLPAEPVSPAPAAKAAESQDAPMSDAAKIAPAKPRGMFGARVGGSSAEKAKASDKAASSEATPFSPEPGKAAEPQRAKRAGGFGDPDSAVILKKSAPAPRPEAPEVASPIPLPAPVPRKMDDMEAKAKAVGQGISAENSNISALAQIRMVEPQQLLGQQTVAVSAVVPETAEFRTLTEESEDGMVARFVQDRLNLIFWLRPPEVPEMVFGCLVEAGHFSDAWKDVLERHRSSPRGSGSRESQPEFVLALLDDRGKPAASQPADAGARDWKHPFVASEIGEALPHWEAALYLASPTALAESARGLWRTLAFTIAGMVALIALGGWLVVADARRQLALAQQKTDFVSNVSHELKTPLTSIRMFAELMHDRPQPAEKQSQYLRIITVEAERLTRLINNVLDFAKLGRKQRRFEKKPLDLHAVIARVWESQGLHLREAGFATRWEAAPGPYPILGDEDALAQVLVNLLSNAEKYSTDRKEVELHTWLDDGHVDIAVMDRGIGVPNGDDRKIFEAFYRAHDSLASGIQGSGLGLTLAQRIAQEHGGEIRFERREGGGCRFTLRVPLRDSAEWKVEGGK